MNRVFASFHDFYPFYLSEHRHPLYSLIGDFAMFRDIVLGRIKF